MKKIMDKLRYKIRSRWVTFTHHKKQQRVRKQILSYYLQHPPHDKEIQEAVTYLSEHPLTTFYGSFQEKYHADEVAVFTDTVNGLPYVMAEGKKLFFKRSHHKRTVQLLYNALRVEQDPDAPHCYIDPAFRIHKEDVLADVGCAEGYFSLLHIEDLKHAYLFEAEPEWVEALEATFAPWKEKVTIIPAFVSDQEGEGQISLDRYFLQHPEIPDFYKIDVEGAEASVLQGMKRLLFEKPAKIALCTYHHQEDFEIFSRFFTQQGFSHRPNPGVMIYQNDLDHIVPPFFRKGLIKATNSHD